MAKVRGALTSERVLGCYVELNGLCVPHGLRKALVLCVGSQFKILHSYKLLDAVKLSLYIILGALDLSVFQMWLHSIYTDRHINVACFR